MTTTLFSYTVFVETRDCGLLDGLVEHQSKRKGLVLSTTQIMVTLQILLVDAFNLMLVTLGISNCVTQVSHL